TEEFLEHFRDWREVVSVSSVGDHFDELHTRSDDPWSVRTRWYERRKRAITMASLPRKRFTRALEIGCSIGELSAELADRCDRLL
ncbi:SAM-dependent methyltransferase, partial [Methylobacterium nigriterrae]|uniref:SAM-dependent methyltransferase n=1 Tax=Methylobacterium nigriterrae TaxID=3127512 RepID=UPI00301418B9